MREIKFRAWDNLERIMLLNVQNTYDYGCTRDNNVMEDRFADLLNEERYIVEQYTGLKDKNGVEIYEGDIVEYGDKTKVHGVVGIGINEWNGQKRNHAFVNWETKHPFRDDLYYWCTKDEIEVIGNIHEDKNITF